MAYQTVSLNDFTQANPVFDGNFTKVIELLPSLGKKGPWLAGGSVRKFLNGEPNYADYDIFFASEQQRNDFNAALEMQGAKLLSSNIFNHEFEVEGYRIQSIHHEYCNTLIQTMDRFDMTICQFGFDGTHLVWSGEAAQDVKKKELHFLNTNDPVYNLNRAFKYAREGGFKPADGEVKKVLARIASGKSSVKNARKISGAGESSVIVNVSDDFMQNGGAAFIGGNPTAPGVPLPIARGTLVMGGMNLSQVSKP